MGRQGDDPVDAQQRFAPAKSRILLKRQRPRSMQAPPLPTSPAERAANGFLTLARGDSTGALAEAQAEPVVLITGIVGRLGRRLARSLHRERAVMGVDRRP